jgi:hypothetical protein
VSSITKLMLALAASGASVALADSGITYERARDPRVGMNLWDVQIHAEQPQRIANQVDQIRAAGFDEVTLIPFAYADLTTGEIRQSWSNETRGTMSDTELSNGIARAKQLGMKVTVTPFIQIRAEPWKGRGDINFTTATTAGQKFWTDYQQHHVRWANVAQQAGADRFNVGSEMAGLDHNAANAASWDSVINAVDAAYTVGQVGYTSQHWHARTQAMRDMIWSHPKIDYVSFSAYPTYQPQFGNPNPGLASDVQALGNASDGQAFVNIVKDNFTTFMNNMLVVGQGVSKPTIIGEFGIPPFDKSSLDPWEWFISTNPADANYRPYDSLEARNAWEGVLRSLDGRKSQVDSLGAWIWGWEGGFAGERFYMRPDATDIPFNDFDETRQNLQSNFLRDYLTGAIPEPASISLLLLPTLAMRRRRA